MKAFQFRPYNKTREIRLGWASWDKNHTEISVKYCWPDSLGRTSRGGEVPVNAVPAMLAMAVRSGYLSPNEIDSGDIEILAEFISAAKKETFVGKRHRRALKRQAQGSGGSARGAH